ncbi:glycosyltransferase family 15 protein [Fomitopsis serialis]|uniref:glycosyltransferase family 15 protein n=1 Tax=Fomitopsis serialis TaxID=139415 RepID=UPI002008D873|nr:glycosyltransferase family 15 protein [Neoantrodia serialis]KAH9926216.1 glycosyltransferase family 15 protein [Neoantrodia serialis]
MMTPMRYVILVLAIIISLHFILSFSHEEYGRATSITRLKEQLQSGPGSKTYESYPTPAVDYSSNPERANATFVLLARNSDLRGIVTSVKQNEDRFNKQYKYPYVFLNEEPFSDEFKNMILEITNSNVEFGLIPHDHWYQPSWIDEDKASVARKQMIKDQVIYGGLSYRNMCRFNSGYYWRIEPDVTFSPFKVMQDGNKVYDFIHNNSDLIPPGNAMSFISDDNGETYNNCHFWSNFEIGDLDFWRGEAYSKFFDALDSKGGFYYERWGDAPVHSIGAALLAKKEQIHFFNDIGYRHNPFQHCPQGDSHRKGQCWCDPSENFDYEWYSCLKRYDALS